MIALTAHMFDDARRLHFFGKTANEIRVIFVLIFFYSDIDHAHEDTIAMPYVQASVS